MTPLISPVGIFIGILATASMPSSFITPLAAADLSTPIPAINASYSNSSQLCASNDPSLLPFSYHTTLVPYKSTLLFSRESPSVIFPQKPSVQGVESTALDQPAPSVGQLASPSDQTQASQERQEALGDALEQNSLAPDSNQKTESSPEPQPIPVPAPPAKPVYKPRPIAPRAPIPHSYKKVNGQRVCAKKNDHPAKSDKNKKKHMDMECCLDPDEYPNPNCAYPSKKYEKFLK